MTDNEIKLSILNSTEQHLEVEGGKAFHKHQFLCNAIQRAARLAGHEMAGRSLADEVEKRIGQGTIEGYLKTTYGVADGDICYALTQPIRRGILRQMVAKYEKLVAAESDPAQQAIDVLEAIKAKWERLGRVTPFVCLQLNTPYGPDGKVASDDICETIKEDIQLYLGLETTVGDYVTSKLKLSAMDRELVARERVKMVDFLIAKYEAELP